MVYYPPDPAATWPHALPTWATPGPDRCRSGTDIKLTWTAGDNADVHFVFGIQTPSYDVGSLVWEDG